MRVLLVGTGAHPIPPPGYGGVERTIAEFAGALAAAGHEPHVIQEVGRGRRSDEYRFARHLRRLISATDADVVHAHTPVVANRLRMMGIPYFYTTHSRHWFVRSGITQRWGYWLERRAVRHSLATVAVTEVVADRIRSAVPSVPARHVVTIPLGVDLDRFSPGNRAGNPDVVLGVGALLPLKRWDWATRALAGSGMRLRLVGPAADARFARELAAAGPVELLGEVSEAELVEEYRRAGMVVHPSRVELFSGAVAQAMASARAVVGGPAVASLVEDGRSGTIVPEAGRAPQEVVADYRHALLRLRNDPPTLEAWGAAARDAAELRFGWPKVVAAHLALYRRLGARA